MAAPRDGEPLNFKSFVVRKKTEYSLRFPFLTERQILAKLRRVWECQKSSAVPRSRKRNQREPVIHSPHVPHRVPITTTGKRGRNEKGDLSAFDIDCDTMVPCETHYTGRYSKCYKSTESSLPNQLRITEHVSDSSYLSSHQLSCRGDETTHRDSQVPVLPVNNTQRQPLQPLQTMPESTLALLENPLTNTSMTTRPTISPHLKSSSCTCTILCRKEAPLCQFCTINTLPFSSSEAQHEHRVSMRNGKTQSPVMASRITWGNLKHVSSRRERGIRDFAAGLHKASSPSQFRDSTSDVPCENTKSGTADVLSGQSVSPSEDTGVSSMSGSPTIQSLPNVVSATSDRDSTTLGSTPLASSTDTITTITAFDSLSGGTSVTPSPRNKSNSPPHDSEVSIVPLSSTLRDNQINSPPSGTPAGTTRPQFQRYRLKRKSRTRSLWLYNNKTTSCSSEYSFGQYDENTHMESVTDTSLMQQCLMYGNGEAVNPKKKQKLSGDCVVEFHENDGVGSSGLCSATDGEMEKHRQALEQIVPEDTIPLSQNGSPTYSSDLQQHESSARPNLMCDMFQLLTPDRPTTVEPHRDGACLGSDGGVHSSSATSKRRIFRSATTESKSNFYSMFMDESDIFM